MQSIPNYPEPLDTIRARIISFHICSVNRITIPWSLAGYLRSVTAMKSMYKPNSRPLVTDKMRLTYASSSHSFFCSPSGRSSRSMNCMNWVGDSLAFVQGKRKLIGILTYPFLHSDWGHLWNNTMSFFTLNSFFFFLSLDRLAGLALVVLYEWHVAMGNGRRRQSHRCEWHHLWTGFPFCQRRNQEKLAAPSSKLAVAFLYGGIIWWMLPIDNHVSWEGHLSGAIVGTYSLWHLTTRTSKSGLSIRKRSSESTFARMVDGCTP